jgi:hypothetical protein
VAHPRSFTFEVDTPLHPRAYWITVETIAEPGRIATVRARADVDNVARLELDNVAAISVWADPQVFRNDRALEVQIEGRSVFSGPVPAAQEVFLARKTGGGVPCRACGGVAADRVPTNPVAHAPKR